MRVGLCADVVGGGLVCMHGGAGGLERDGGNVRCTEALELCTWISLGRFSFSSASQELIATQFLCEDREKSMIDISTVYQGLEVILWLFCVIGGTYLYFYAWFKNFRGKTGSKC